MGRPDSILGQIGDAKVDFCIRTVMCCHLATDNVLFLCQQDCHKTARLFCMRFSRKAWSDHGRPEYIFRQFQETA